MKSPITLFAFWLLLAGNVVAQEKQPRKLSFPTDAGWKTVAPESLGIDKEALDKALDFAMEHRSSSVVITVAGKIVAERHKVFDPAPILFRRAIHGETSDGQQIEDVASVQKSVVSVLMGIALHKRLLQLDDPVTKHLGAGWSKAEPEKEAAITLRHLISMTSGLSEKLEYRQPAGSRWAYNTSAYAKSMDVIVKVSGKSRNDVTSEWLTQPVGMNDSKWVPRRGVLGSSVSNGYGFATTGRDLARLGLLMLNQGKWNGKTIVENTDYLSASISPSQKLNPSYGYLWWLNGQAFTMRGRRKVNGPLLNTAPTDLYAAQGALGRKCYVVPSMQLVVTRLGNSPDSTGKKKFDREFWRLLMTAFHENDDQ